MRLEDVRDAVGDLPHMSLAQAVAVTAFIREHDIEQILELGFRYGVSTCYMAAALDELGRGGITTIDLSHVQAFDPNIEVLLGRLGLRDRVRLYYEPSGYIWRLMKLLEEDPTPRFDFCYIDGAHNWATDGFAFFLVDRLLKPGGWIIFDDLDWTYASSPSWSKTELVKAMPADERTTPQVRKVFELLVAPHPDYSEHFVKGAWGYARKRAPTVTGA